ncbi:MAG: hypothetical protein ACR2Q4_05750 [Geminicoccaceae bacterium]
MADLVWYQTEREAATSAESRDAYRSVPSPFAAENSVSRYN